MYSQNFINKTKIMLRTLYTIVLFFVLNTFTYAGISVYSEAIVVTPGQASASILIEDEDYYFLNPANSVINYVFFEVDEASAKIVPGAFSYEVNLTIRLWYQDPATSNPPDDTFLETLTLNYNPDTKKLSDYKAFKKYSGAHKMEIIINSVTASTGWDGIAPDLRVKGEVIVDREFLFYPNIIVNFSTVGTYTSSSPNHTLSWDNVPGAEEYDFEWTFYDKESHVGQAVLAGQVGTLNFDALFKNNATRVSPQGNQFTIQSLYPEGYIFYRARGVKINSNGSRIHGPWYGNTSQRYAVDWHEGGGLNFATSTQFSEDGVNLPSINYFDDSGRSRQNVTLNNAIGKGLYSNISYDYHGRVSLGTMPAPTGFDYLAFDPNQTLTTSGAKYLKSDFVEGDYSLANRPKAMGTSDGVGKYFSDQNDEINSGSIELINNVPKAGGYPFSITEYAPDETGRIARESSFGAIFQFESGHDSRYLYGKPSQEELDRLFGNDVGDASHYLKNAIVDPNEQVSISYTDLAGRTIATSLAGPKPANVEILDSGYENTETLTVDLLSSNDTVDFALISSYKHISTSAGLNTFNYSLNELVYQDDCVDPSFCYDCLYDLEIKITDSRDNNFNGGNPFIYTVDNFSAGAYLDTLCTESNTGAPIVASFDLTMPIGEYTITKTLRISQSSLDYYTEHFMANQTCVKFEDYFDSYLMDIDSSGCNMTCESCMDSLGSRASLTSALIAEVQNAGATMNQAEADAVYDLRASECEALCETLSECDNWLAMLIFDMTPLGQYAKFDLITILGVDTISSTDSTSIFFENAYQNLGMPYLDANGNVDSVYNTQGILVAPKDLTAKEFIKNFKKSWGLLLAEKLHPEWCVYNEWCNNQGYDDSADFDAALLEFDCFQDAVDAGFADANGMINDPLFGGVDSSYCFDLLATDYNANYNIYINGQLQAMPYNSCGGITLYKYYSLQPLINVLATYNDIVNASWTINGNTETFSFYTVEELIDSMSVVDVVGDWELVSTVNEVASLNTNASWIYFSFNQGNPSSIGSSGGSRFFYTAVELVVPGGSSEIVVENTSTGVSDTSYVTNGTGLDSLGECQALLDSLMANISWGNAGSPSVLDYVTDIFYGDCQDYIGTDCTPLDNEAWTAYVSIYLGLKNQVTNSKRDSSVSCPGFDVTCIGNGEALCAGLPNIYWNKERRITSPNHLGNGPLTADDIESASDSIGMLLETQCAEVCAVNADLWINELSDCDLTGVNITTLKNRLIAVCELGCDYTHDGGSSTTANGQVTSFGDTSFEDVLNSMLSSQVNPCNLGCNSLSIASMRPYDKPLHPGPTPTNSLVNNCLCENLTELETCYNNDVSGNYNSFAEYLVQYSEYVLVQDQLDSLLHYCSSNYTELLMPRSYPIPAYLECSTCQDCGQISALKSTFDNANGCTSSDPDYWDVLARYLNNELGFNQTGYDYEEFVNTCNNPPGGGCTDALIICPTTGTQDLLAYASSNPCVDGLLMQVGINASLELQQALEALKQQFRNDYMNHCLRGAVEVFEGLMVNQQYHYTLYYYDRSGNLRQTVPPNGVHQLTAQADLDQVKAYRETGAGSPEYPLHDFITRYEYNSVNQITHQINPDGLVAQFWYDELGRMIISQDGRQFEKTLFSYKVYDPLSRIKEVGEVDNTQANYDITSSLSADHFIDIVEFDQWINSFPIGTKQDVTKTYYDETPFNIPAFGSEGQQNTLTRISSTTREAVDDEDDQTYDFATHYSYDVVGNASSLVQEIAALHNWGQGFKRMDYVFDIISANINYVFYQTGEADQFTHHYVYDKNNRLTGVYSSFVDTEYYDGGIWEEEAIYEYYDHGPLGRTVIGNQQVQGCDYTYTIHDWIKGVNSTLLDIDKDMGKDGNPAEVNRANVARDVLSYTLNYFDGDYQPISGVSMEAEIPTNSNVGTTAPSLYNGNIRTMTIHNQRFGDPVAYAYSYDQLHRIKSMESFDNLDISSYEWGNTTGIESKYAMNTSFDGNGNIQTLQRYGLASPGTTTTSLIDDLTYTYLPKTNKLLSYSDDSPVCDPIIYVTEPINIESISQALDELYASSWVTGEEDVVFQAGQFVELLPGFEIGAGEGEFIAQVEDCQSPGAGQNTGVYDYDGSGNLIQNEDGAQISWDLYGKVEKVLGLGSSQLSQVNYGYDPVGDRIAKTAIDGVSMEEVTTFYIRDVSGNVMATYKLSDSGFSWQEQFLYGRSRLGAIKGLADWANASEIPNIPLKIEEGGVNRGRKYYELSNHLGNVLSVINDRKIKVDLGSDGFADYYEATIVSANDYYPFGLEMPQRIFSSSDYRYGFNGKEKDQSGEWGSLTHYDYGFRIYNPVIGRFLSVDPLSPDYPELTPYQFASNRPIDGVDIDGLEWGKAAKYAAKQTLKKLAKEQIESQIKKRLKGYTSKKWAKQLAGDAIDAFDLLESAWWELAVEFIPQVGDAYAIGSTGYKGYKFWKRIDRISDRIDAVADNVKSASTKLKKALGGLPKGQQAHHLIPVQALKESAVVQDAIAAGFKFNGKKNGIGVKALKNGVGQHANHPAYNTQVLDKLKKFAQDNPDYTPKQAREFVEELSGQLKKKVQKESVKGGKKVNALDLFSKPPRA